MAPAPTAAPPKPDAEPREGADLIDAAARGRKLSGEEVHNALDYFLSIDPNDSDTDSFQINMGGPIDAQGNALDADKPPVWLTWTIRALDDTEIDKIRKQSTTGNRNQKRRGEGDVDETQVARRMVFAGTVDPNIAEYAKAKSLADPADAVRAMFKRKSGLVLQISGRILNFSGYDENDVREVEAGKD